ncbi:MAG: hypothetical protein GWP22_09050 [Actinomycetales bacterium]|nr:hypothetical protein [Actinomycetales bacterium]
MSGWWYFLGLVPFGGLVLIDRCASAGTTCPNRYGARI